jgi:vacuolar-type H+-ATPase subunit I/STV1
MSAYIVDFGRDQAWISGHLPANFLMLFEELMVFGGYVMFVPPLYAIGKVLGDPKKAISDVVLPEVTQLLARSFLFLCYLVLLWSQLAYYVNIISTVFANSLIVGLAGIALTFAKLQGWKKRMVPWLLSLPLIVSLGIVLVVLVIVALSVLHLTI